MAEEPREQCERCAAGRENEDDMDKKLAELRVVGSEHHGGESKTDYTNYVCELCGAKWCTTVDSGSGGHAFFMSRGHIEDLKAPSLWSSSSCSRTRRGSQAELIPAIS